MAQSPIEQTRVRTFHLIHRSILKYFSKDRWEKYPEFTCSRAGWLKMSYTFTPTWKFLLTVHETVSQADYVDVSVVIDDAGQKLIFMDSIDVNNPVGIENLAKSCVRKIEECMLSKQGRKLS